MKVLNKDTRVKPSGIFDTQLRVLVDELKRKQQAGDLYSIENTMTETAKLLSSFASNLGSPIGHKKLAVHDSAPDIDNYNENLRSILVNLEVLFEESDNIESNILQSFNFVVAEAARISKEIQEISSTLADYTIYTNSISSGIAYYTDSFNNISKIEQSSKFISTDVASVNEIDGTVTLAVDNELSSLRSVASVSIGEISNGNPGNNNQVGAQINDDITTLLDGNPDTWFEYEIVKDLNSPLEEPLVMEILVELDSVEIINSIVVDPNDFGTKNKIVVSQIETSVDSEIWTPIDRNSTAADFLGETQEEEFTLSASSSKFKGKGVFSFFPRSAKYLHIVFEQFDHYLIETISGEKLRYAIGIKDIEIYGNKFLQEGEIVSTRYYTESEIKKVSIETSQSIDVDESLASILHFISPDDGGSWHEIQPRNIQKSIGVPEVLNFNSIDENSISTNAPVNFIRYKIRMKRESSQFNEATNVISESKRKASETFSLADKSPVKLHLENPPVSSSVVVLDPLYGSVGNNSLRNLVGISSGESNQQSIIPWLEVERNTEQIWVGGSLWHRVPALSGATSTEQAYSLNYETGELSFGDGTTGAVPKVGSKIEMNFAAESLWFESGNIAKLNFPADGDKNNFILNRIEEETDVYNELLVKRATIHRLANRYISSGSVSIEDPGSVFSTEQTYVDGTSELATGGDYSINYDEGIMYSYTYADDTDLTNISYKYTPKILIDTAEWDFYSSVDNPSLVNQIKLKGVSVSSLSITDEALTQDIRVVKLTKSSVIPGSTIISEEIDGSNTGRLVYEVPFIDGIQELNDLIQVTDEPVLVGQTSFILKSFASGVTISTSPTPIFFEPTPTAFITEVGGDPANPGEYKINYNTGIVQVYASTPTIAGTTVNYFYLTDTVDFSGYFSVDYENGIIYTYDVIYQNTKISYDYSNYEAVYNIARIVEADNYITNSLDRSVTVYDNEIIKNIVRSRQTGIKTILKIIYDYIDKDIGSLSDIEPYYTPVIKGYAVSIIDKDNLR